MINDQLYPSSNCIHAGAKFFRYTTCDLLQSVRSRRRSPSCQPSAVHSSQRTYTIASERSQHLCLRAYRPIIIIIDRKPNSSSHSHLCIRSSGVCVIVVVFSVNVYRGLSKVRCVRAWWCDYAHSQPWTCTRRYYTTSVSHLQYETPTIRPRIATQPENQTWRQSMHISQRDFLLPARIQPDHLYSLIIVTSHRYERSRSAQPIQQFRCLISNAPPLAATLTPTTQFRNLSNPLNGVHTQTQT